MLRFHKAIGFNVSGTVDRQCMTWKPWLVGGNWENRIRQKMWEKKQKIDVLCFSEFCQALSTYGVQQFKQH